MERSDARLLRTSQAVSEFLSSAGGVRPNDAVAPEADLIHASTSFSPEPMGVQELRTRYLDENHALPEGSVQLDGVWRLITKRTRPIAVRDRERNRSVLRHDASAHPAH